MKNLEPQITLMSADFKKDRFLGHPGRAARRGFRRKMKTPSGGSIRYYK